MVFANGLPALPRRDARRGDFGEEAAVGGGSGEAGCALGRSERLCLVRVATPNGDEDAGKKVTRRVSSALAMEGSNEGLQFLIPNRAVLRVLKDVAGVVLQDRVK